MSTGFCSTPKSEHLRDIGGYSKMKGCAKKVTIFQEMHKRCSFLQGSESFALHEYFAY